MRTINEIKAEIRVCKEHIYKAELKIDELMRELETMGSKVAQKTTKYNFQRKAELLGYEIEPEKQFAKGERQFRSDWVVSYNGKSVGIEYMGITSKSFLHFSRGEGFLVIKVEDEFDEDGELLPNEPFMHYLKGKSTMVQTMNGHTSPMGYKKDCEKRNLAVSYGLYELSYIASNFDNVWADLERFFNA